MYCQQITSARILSLNTVYIFRERGPAIAGFKRDRCVVAVSSAAMSDVKFWDAGGGIVLPHLVPKSQAKMSCHGRQSDSLLCLTGSMEAALQLRRAAVSLGRGVVAHVRYVILNQRN